MAEEVLLADITTKRRGCGSRGARSLVIGGLRGLSCVLTGAKGALVLDMEGDEDEEETDNEEMDEDSDNN